MSSAKKAVYEVPQKVIEFLPKFRKQYRDLLREASYLPDSAARIYAHESIVKRFNPYNPRKLDPRYWGTDFLRSKFDPKTIEQRSKKAAQKLHLLERINLEGSTKDWQTVLLRTYGRAGKRRRELLSQLLQPGEDEVPQDDTALEALMDSQILKNLDATKDVEIDIANAVSKRKRREHKQMTMFLASQQENNPIESMRGRIRKLKPELPATNAWGRKLTEARKENTRRAWWADILERVLPPLPEHEWNRLADLAEGREPIEQRRPRRKPATSSDTKEPQPASELNALLNTPARLNTKYWAEAPGESDSDDPPTIQTNTRAMRRMYGMIWSLSAKMVQSEKTGTYTVTWGGQRSLSASGKITQSSSQDAELFEKPDDGLAEEGILDRQFKKIVGRNAKKLIK
ncbi:hypothetical protein SBOR_4386 [Sclerotinia borealis F-4128]|uniref:LYR motif-containing protein Cup1-like N-terminal domain-containing protein n=1 Tax=Sclerotinia borealis (strain F-4128) TaxID=1432307 RepID=W9CH74_SCLBF|nr:hypothetical protein SBOR_4386 [Sclerotinia borealis F-4128]